MSSASAGLCLHGHDLAVLGKTKHGKCRACAYARTAAWRKTPNGRAYKALENAAWRRSPEGKAYMDRYRASVKGQLSDMRSSLKRNGAAKEDQLAELGALFLELGGTKAQLERMLNGNP